MMELTKAKLQKGAHGRGAVALQRLNIGECVTPSEKALAFVVLWKKRRSLCWNCLTEAPKLQQCGSCKEARYCNGGCQKDGWMSHRLECRHISRLMALSLNAHQMTLALLALRLLGSNPHDHLDLDSSSASTVPTLSEDPFTLFTYQVFDHSLFRTFSEEKLEQLQRLFEEVGISQVPVSALRAVLSRFQMNSFYISNALFQPVAAAVYTLGAFLNHSCVPNTIASYDPLKKTQIFRAISDIAPGTELTHSYVDLASSTRERTVILETDYGFRCDCPHCSDPSGRQISSKSYLSTLTSIIGDNAALMRELRDGGIGNDMFEADDYLYRDRQGQVVVETGLEGFQDVPESGRNHALQRYLSDVCKQIDSLGQDDLESTYEAYILALRDLVPKFHFFNRSIYSMMSECYSLALDLGYNEEALEMADRLIAWDLAVYWPVKLHPVPNLLLLTYGQLVLEIKHDRAKALAVFNRCSPAIEAIYPQDHPFLESLKELKQKASASN